MLAAGLNVYGREPLLTDASFPSENDYFSSAGFYSPVCIFKTGESQAIFRCVASFSVANSADYERFFVSEGFPSILHKLHRHVLWHRFERCHHTMRTLAPAGGIRSFSRLSHLAAALIRLYEEKFSSISAAPVLSVGPGSVTSWLLSKTDHAEITVPVKAEEDEIKKPKVLIATLFIADYLIPSLP